jgi:hypothetical protein
MDGENESVEPLGKRIRQFFRDLFGSRITEHLEIELIQLRQDFEQRLQDQGLVIAALQEEKALLNAKIIVYENTVMSHSSRMGAEVVAYQKPKPPKPNFSFVDIPPTQSRWEKVQQEHDAKIAQELKEEAAAEEAKKAATAA